MTSFYVICGLGLPHSKILGSLINRRSPEKIFKDLFFRRTLTAVSLVLGLGLEHSCPWPREVLSSKRLSLALALASDFFCVLGLGLEPCVLDSTSANLRHLILFQSLEWIYQTVHHISSKVKIKTTPNNTKKFLAHCLCAGSLYFATMKFCNRCQIRRCQFCWHLRNAGEVPSIEKELHTSAVVGNPRHCSELFPNFTKEN